MGTATYTGFLTDPVGAALIDMHEWIAGDRRYLSEGSMAKRYETSDTEPVAAIESSDV